MLIKKKKKKRRRTIINIISTPQRQIRSPFLWRGHLTVRATRWRSFFPLPAAKSQSSTMSDKCWTSPHHTSVDRYAIRGRRCHLCCEVVSLGHRPADSFTRFLAYCPQQEETTEPSSHSNSTDRHLIYTIGGKHAPSPFAMLRPSPIHRPAESLMRLFPLPASRKTRQFVQYRCLSVYLSIYLSVYMYIHFLCIYTI